MTAFWCGVWRRPNRFVEASSFPTRPKKSRRKVRLSPYVKPGDRILFGKYSGTEIKIDGEEFLMMREEEVLGILKKK
jgi:co-chaperonin GroES (HSP10)